jgi:hypothetical protein
MGLFFRRSDSALDATSGNSSAVSRAIIWSGKHHQGHFSARWNTATPGDIILRLLGWV